MLTVAICDDIPLHCRRMEELLKEKLPVPAEIELFYSPANLLTAIETDKYMPQLALLDIEMDGINGIELAQQLNRLVPDCRVIFITAYEQYAPAAYRAEHVWFIPKTEAETYLGDALDKALASKKAGETEHVLHLRIRGKSILLPVNKVMYLERRGRQTIVITEEEQYTVAAHPQELLADDRATCFIRCHQSYWVNRSFIETLDHDVFVLKNGERIQLGRTFRLEARRAFFEWLKEA